jgi:large subunit ribosomal protein L7/L12
MAVKHEKLIQEISGMTVLELNDFVEDLQTTFGVSAVMSMGAPAAATPAEQQKEEKSEYKVTLQEAGANTIEVIKAVRKVTTLSLVDAKKAVVEAPTVLAEAASKEDAAKMKEALEAAGAKVQLS